MKYPMECMLKERARYTIGRHGYSNRDGLMMKVSNVRSVERKQKIDHVDIQPMAKDLSLSVK